MADKPRWKEAMSELFATDKYEPVAPVGAWPIEVPVRAGVESIGPGRPAFTAGVEAGPVSLEGSYQKRDEYSPAEWKTMLGYRRSF